MQSQHVIILCVSYERYQAIPCKIIGSPFSANARNSLAGKRYSLQTQKPIPIPGRLLQIYHTSFPLSSVLSRCVCLLCVGVCIGVCVCVCVKRPCAIARAIWTTSSDVPSTGSLFHFFVELPPLFALVGELATKSSGSEPNWPDYGLAALPLK